MLVRFQDFSFQSGSLTITTVFFLKVEQLELRRSYSLITKYSCFRAPSKEGVENAKS